MEIIGTILTLIVILLPFYLFYRRKMEKQKFVKAAENSPIDHQLLSQAEEAVRDLDIQKELYKNHLPIKNFYSLHGYDEKAMNDIVLHLQQNNISAEYHFIQSLPAGVASYISGTGTYQLFVDKNKTHEAKEALTRYLNKEN